jgi:hypothetical protein
VVQESQEYATPLNRLIDPSDVSNQASEWSDIDGDVLDEEIQHSVSIILQETRWHSKIGALLYDYALIQVKDDLMRAPIEDLSFTSRKRAVKEGYWPYDMCEGRAMEILTQTYESIGEIPPCYVTHAREAISEGLHKGMTPEGALDHDS